MGPRIRRGRRSRAPATCRIALGRRLVAAPESRAAGIFFAALSGTRAGRTTSYQLQNELSLGDKLDRDVFWASWRSEPAVDWRLTASPRVEYRRDRTFDRD